MLAAGQYGAMSFAAYPRRIDHSVGSFSHCMPLQRRRYPPDMAVFFTGLRAGLFLWAWEQVNDKVGSSILTPFLTSVILASSRNDGKLRE